MQTYLTKRTHIRVKNRASDDKAGNNDNTRFTSPYKANEEHPTYKGVRFNLTNQLVATTAR